MDKGLWAKFSATGYPTRTLWPSLHVEHDTRGASQRCLPEMDCTRLSNGTLGIYVSLEADTSQENDGSIKDADLANNLDLLRCFITLGYSSTKGDIQTSTQQTGHAKEPCGVRIIYHTETIWSGEGPLLSRAGPLPQRNDVLSFDGFKRQIEGPLSTV